MRIRRTSIGWIVLLAAFISLGGAALAANGYGASTAKVKTVPRDLIHQRLPDAESELTRDQIKYQVIGGGLFGIVIKSDWEVCQTKPKGGQPVTGKVSLIVEHYVCT